MRRIHPLILIALLAVLIVGGLCWKITSAKDCMEQGGTVVGPMTRNQECGDAR